MAMIDRDYGDEEAKKLWKKLKKKIPGKTLRQIQLNAAYICIYVTDDVSDFMLDLCYALNCILKLNPNPCLLPTLGAYNMFESNINP